ncbi:MAG: DUF3999 family protein, partial [Burkholderiaceae bacterium]|nr:DUF3999 family protein [Burkholderiaceae bacterium]
MKSICALTMMLNAARTATLATCIALPVAAAAQAPADFAWRGTLEVPPQASLVRAALPADALMRLRSAQASDVRVFDAKGQPVPFALAAPVDQPRPARQTTAAFNALPLFSAQPGLQIPPSGVQVRVDEGGQQRSVWVQMGPQGSASTASPATAANATRLPSALFDARASAQTITAIVIKAQLPANAPIRFNLSASADLAQWASVPLRGRAYRFDGEGAPVNDTLELDEPLKLQGHYLRLDWQGQEGVVVEALQGLVAPPVQQAAQVSAPLPEPRHDGAQALEWDMPSATPLAALALSTSQANTLLPVRVLGRNQASEPWRLLSQGVIFRLGSGAGESANTPLPMPRVAVRWLRVEATNGLRLEGVPLAAKAVFDPVELVFVAGGSGPYELAAGRTDTPPASLPLGMLAAVATGRIEDLPVARITASSLRPDTPPSA